MSRRLAAVLAIASVPILTFVACSGSSTPGNGSSGITGVAWSPHAGGSPAAFTTFDSSKGGCLDSPNGVDCNNYVAKDDVYMNGGPATGCLDNGTYFFAVVEPGSKKAALVDGSAGNLSQDAMSARTFSITSCAISYNGPHALGTAPNGQTIIQLMPYADTLNPGGVYQLVICEQGATSVSQCKSDNFKIKMETPPPPPSGDMALPPPPPAADMALPPPPSNPDMAHIGPCQ